MPGYQLHTSCVRGSIPFLGIRESIAAVVIGLHGLVCPNSGKSEKAGARINDIEENALVQEML